MAALTFPSALPIIIARHIANTQKRKWLLVSVLLCFDGQPFKQ
jgi:hypothetical protein